MGPTLGRDDVELIQRDTLYQGFFRLEALELRHRLFEGGWSATMRREVHNRFDAVGVLLYDPHRDALVLIEQFRAGAIDDPTSPWKLEFVAGLADKDESLEDVARREALEEAGCQVGQLTKLHTYYPSPGACNERVTLFCGLVDTHGLGGVYGVEDEHEDIRQLALHRFQTVTPSAETFRPCQDFSIETYVQQGNFDYPVDSQPVELVADIYQDLAWKLEETPLSNDQQLSAPNEQGRVELRATVPNDKQTLWWIRGMGPAFLVRQPAEWRDALAADAAQVLAHAKTCGYQPAAEDASS